MTFDGSGTFKRMFADFVFTRFLAFCLIQENQLSLFLQSTINRLISVLMAECFLGVSFPTGCREPGGASVSSESQRLRIACG